MDLDFGRALGDSSQERPSHNRRGLTANKAKAILYAFKPVAGMFRDVGIRPLTYNFDQNFVHTTQELAEDISRGRGLTTSVIDDLGDRVNIDEYMQPSSSLAGVIRASAMPENYYRFLLIFTEATRNLITGKTFVSSGENSCIRRVYTGFFTDEPFSFRSFSENRKPRFNPDATMIITHKSVIGTHTEHGSVGSETSLNLRSSEEVLNPELLKAFGDFDSRVHVMTPDATLGGVEFEGDMSFSMPGASSVVTGSKNSQVFADLFEQPKHNVSQVLRGVMKLSDDINLRNKNRNYRGGYRTSDRGVYDEDQSRRKLARYMQIPQARKVSPLDLDVNDAITGEDIDAMVNGDLDVVPYCMEGGLLDDSLDQTQQSILNQYSFLIASVVSPILTSVGLNEMDFEYFAESRRGVKHEHFQTFGAAAMYDVEDVEVRSMTRAVETELINGIFDVIYNVTEGFAVSVKANATGITSVRLNSEAFGPKNYQYFDFPSCFGGLVSPLLGNDIAATSNSQSIEELHNAITGSRSAADMVDDDDEDYRDVAARASRILGRDRRNFSDDGDDDNDPVDGFETEDRDPNGWG